MGIEVEGPDGKVHTFPDGTPQDQIMGEMSKLYNVQGTLSAVTPQTGRPTAASGAIMPHMMSTPAYRSDEDWEQLLLSRMFPHAQSIIQNTPAHKMRSAAAEGAGKNLAKIEEKQRAGTQILNVLGQLRTTADEAHTGVKDAKGNYVKAPSLAGAIGPMEGGAFAQKIRQMIPGVAGYYENEYNTNNRLHHIIHGLTTAFVTASAGQNMSDARQKAFEETMGAMMHATSKEEFDKILHDAEAIIKDTFGLTPGAYAQPTQSNRVPQQAPSVRQQFRNQKTGELETFEVRNGQWVKVQ